MELTILGAILLAIVAVTFALQNAALVTVTLFRWTFDGSLALVLLITFACGCFIGWLLSLPSILRRHRVITGQQRRLQALEASLETADPGHGPSKN